MEKDKYCSGVILFMNANSPYTFDGKILSLFVSKKVAQDLLLTEIKKGTYTIPKETKPLPTDRLEGTINGSTKQIVFFFDPRGYRYATNFINLEKTAILIPITRYEEVIYCTNQDTNFLCYESDQFFRFLGMLPNYNAGQIGKTDSILKADVTCDFSMCNKTSSFSIDGCEIVLKPSCSYSWGGSKFSIVPSLLLIIDSNLTDDMIWKLYSSLQRLVQYSFYRMNIHPMQCFYETKKSKVTLYENHGEEKLEGPEQIDEIRGDSIPWSILYKHAGDIFKEIYDGTLYLAHIGEDKTARNWASIYTITRDAPAFENSFDILYPNGFPHSQERITAETNATAKIAQLIETSSGKEKEIYKGFAKHVRMEALKDKMMYALSQFAGCLGDIKRNVSTQVDDETIANTCSGLRNEIDHGDKQEGITQQDASCFGILRALIYGMQLKHFGYEEEDITAAIRSLFGIIN